MGWVGFGWVGLGWVGLGWVGLGWVRLGAYFPVTNTLTFFCHISKLKSDVTLRPGKLEETLDLKVL